MKKKKVTLAAVLDAMAQNNIPFATVLTNNTSRYIGGTPVIASACAMGQAAINLGLSPQALQSALHTYKFLIDRNGKQEFLDAVIVTYNDGYRFSPDATAAKIVAQLTPQQLNTEIEVVTMFTASVIKAS